MEEKDKSAKVEIEIVKFKRLLNALENPKLLWKLILSFGAMIVLLFLGLSMVAVIIKSMFPYETIKTNPYGATIMEDEDKEVVYWLFNSSELWANSGIKVEKGDVLTIRSSGKMHTAIHHLYDAAKGNFVPAEAWSDTDGDLPTADSRNAERAEYRIAPNTPQNKLLMQVVNNVNADGPKLDGEKYKIGKERSDIIMTEDGYLYFAVNDIEMTDTVIDSMYRNFMEDVIAKTELSDTARKQWREFYKKFIAIGNKKDQDSKIRSANLLSYIRREESGTEEKRDTTLDRMTRYIAKECGQLTKELSRSDRNTIRLCGVGLGSYHKQDTLYPILNEAVYYKIHDFTDAWFADNIGSFLIVIEITKRH